MRNIYDIEPGDVFWAASDVGWVVGHSYIVYGPLLLGATTVLYEGKPVGTPDPGAFWRVAAEHRVKALFTAPTAIRAISKEDPDGTHLGQLRPVGAAVSVPGRRAARPRHLPLGVGEAGHPGRRPLVADRDRLGDRRQSDGRRTAADIKPGSPTVPMPGYDVRILHADGSECRPGEEGAICVKLPLPPGTLPTLWGDDDRYEASYLCEHPRLLPDRRRRLHRRGRLPVRDGPHRRRHQRCGTPLVDRIDRGGAGRASRRRGVRGDRRRRRDQGPGAARPRRAQGRRVGRRSGRGTGRSRARRDRRGRLLQAGRRRARAAEDAVGQDPAQDHARHRRRHATNRCRRRSRTRPCSTR